MLAYYVNIEQEEEIPPCGTPAEIFERGEVPQKNGFLMIFD